MKSYTREKVLAMFEQHGLSPEQIEEIIRAQEKLEAKRGAEEFGLRLVRPLELARIVVKKIRRVA